MIIENVLITAGADLSKANDVIGDTPLHDASYNGRLKTVKVLLAVGTEVNKTNNYGTDEIRDFF